MRCLSIVLLSWGAGLEDARAAMTVDDLRCEGRREPLGIDAPRPRLSWVLRSDRRSAMQGAYRVLVASSPEALGDDRGDLWDSGKVASDRSIHVEYEGKALSSRTACHWKVMVWDGGGEPSAWSRPASFSMGLLGPGAWRARWIGAASRNAAGLDGAAWVWFPEADPPPPGTRSFRKRFTVGAGAKVRRAALRHGDSDAMFQLGCMIEDGKAGPRDPRGALRWYRRAAAVGDELATLNIGYAYHEGIGVRKDFLRAVAWYRKAAQGGAEGAMWNLGLSYLEGEGVRRNKAFARRWFEKAAARGHPDAKRKLKEMEGTRSRRG